MRAGVLLGLPVEGVDFRGSSVAEQERRIVGCQAEPDIPKTSLPEVFQIGHALQFLIANAHSHYRRLILFVQEGNILSVFRPIGKTHGDLRDLPPLLRFKIEEHQATGIEWHRSDITPIGRPAGRVKADRLGEGGNLMSADLQYADAAVAIGRAVAEGESCSVG